MRVVMDSVGVDPLFRATGEGSGQTILVDVRSGENVEPVAPDPMEMICMGLGGCLGENVVQILKKKRIPFAGVRMEIDGERAPKSPRRFTALHVRCVVDSAELKPGVLARVLELATQYCSAYNTLAMGAPVSTEGVIEPL